MALLHQRGSLSDITCVYTNSAAVCEVCYELRNILDENGDSLQVFVCVMKRNDLLINVHEFSGISEYLPGFFSSAVIFF